MDFLEGETCERCSAIPWVRWYVSNYEKLYFTETPDELQSAACPICRVIGRGIAGHNEPITCLEQSGTHMMVGSGTLFWRSNLMLYDKDDDAFVQACRVHPKRVDFAHAKRWIRACVSSHEECKPPLGSVLHDLKVLDCHNRIVVSAPEHCEYVALSYVWGKAGLEDAPDFPRIPVILPRTVEDSIKATIMLGYRYLWIDRYCVDQSDAIAQQHQINQMGTIYSSSQVTIIAAAGLEEWDSDATHGLPGITDDFRTPSSCAVTDRIRLVHTRWTNLVSIKLSNWYSRGWTFQEGYLSRRRMYFTDVGVEYICDNDRGSEAAIGLAGTLRNPVKAPFFDFKEQMMHEYTRRRLTYSHDALNAIIGALESEESDDHIWGVFVVRYHPNMYMFLHWRHSSPVPRLKQFPSWSPIGWHGSVDYPYRVDYPFRKDPCISKECTVEVWCNGEYKPLEQGFGKLSQQHHLPGAEQSRFLRVTTKIVTVEFVSLRGKAMYPREGLHARIPYGEALDVFLFAFWDTEEEPVCRSDKGGIYLPCAVIVRRPDTQRGQGHSTRFEDESQILVLRHHDTHYERIGYFAWDLIEYIRHDPGEPGDDDFSQDPYLLPATMHALDKQGKRAKIPILDEDLYSHGDGRYWLKDGVETTFLLG